MSSRDHPAATQSRRGPVPSMAPGGRVSLVGTEHHQVVLHRRRRAAALVVRGPSVLAELVPEPSNRDDRNAIAVFIGGDRVGYIAKSMTRSLRGALERCVKAGRAPTCGAAFVVGGPMPRGQVGVDLDVALDRCGWPKAA